jgi:hypothetical protein
MLLDVPRARHDTVLALVGAQERDELVLTIGEHAPFEQCSGAQSSVFCLDAAPFVPIVRE